MSTNSHNDKRLISMALTVLELFSVNTFNISIIDVIVLKFLFILVTNKLA